jgi:ubiquitin carboxyl-terminal hydrolase 10
MARWFTHLSPFVSDAARISVAVNLTRTQERDTRWVVLANNAYGLAASVLLRNVALGGDNVLLAILNHVSRQGIWEVVKELAHFDIRHTLPGLQHDFCTMWNEVVQKARDEERNLPDYFRFVDILHQLRRHYITLHQGTDAAPTAFVNEFHIPMEPSSYPLCDIASHRSDSITDVPQPAHSLNASPHHSTSGGSVSQLVRQASIIGGSPPLPEWTKPSEIGDNSQGPAVTSPALPVHAVTSPCPTDASPLGAVAAVLQNNPLAATDNSEILSHASTLAPTPTLAPVPATDTAILSKSFTSRDAGIADPFLPASSVASFSIPVSPPPSRVHPSPKTLSNLTGNATLPRLRARGLVNSGNMSFANAVLHLLVHSPPFWNLFVELGDLKGKCGVGSPETGCATPLVDVTLRFFEEFIFKEEPPTTQQPLQLAARGKQREEEKKERKVVDSFDPTYLYDVMKEKSQLKNLLVSSSRDAHFWLLISDGFCVKDGKHEDAEEFLGLYLDVLENELDELHTYISTQKPTSAPSVEELEKETQSVEDQTEAGKRDHAVYQ